MTRTRVGVALLALVAVATPARAETATWASTYPIQTGAEERIEVAPDASAWAVIDHNRVLKSTDAGRTWTPVNVVPLTGAGLPLAGPDQGGSSETSVAPVSGQVALAANANAFSVTHDGGLTWSPVKVPTVTSPDGIQGSRLLRRTGGRYWSAMEGFEIVGHCAVPLRTTPLLSSVDGTSWRRVDLPVRSGAVRDLKFADALHGTLSVYDYHFTPVNNRSGCGFEGSTSDTVAFVTVDGGRSWKRVLTCIPSCSVGWARGKVLTLTLGLYDGTILDSTDLGRHFRRTAQLPVLPEKVLGLHALDCSGARCWALVNGTGIYRRDGSGEWVLERSDADAPGICLAGIAAIDHDRAIAAGPHALMTRGTVPAGVATPSLSGATRVRVGRLIVRPDGTAAVRVVL